MFLLLDWAVKPFRTNSITGKHSVIIERFSRPANRLQNRALLVWGQRLLASSLWSRVPAVERSVLCLLCLFLSVQEVQGAKERRRGAAEQGRMLG
jgi:hypothetical protein